MPNVARADIDVLLARSASISFIAALPEPERAGVLDDVRAIVTTDPDAWEGDDLVLPYVTEATWARAV